MKELSIEQKARRYDEISKEVKDFFDCKQKMYSDVGQTLNHLFPELKESEDEKIRKCVKYAIDKLFLKEKIVCDVHKDKVLAWLEKQGEKKPADKVEPKFHEGEWVVTDKENTVQIKAIENGNYVLENSMKFPIGYVNKCWRKWDITKDAKDGDVLVNGSNIFIFHFLNDTRLMGYCHVNTDDGRFYDDIGKNECFCLIDAIVNPATKEQRDTLIKAMADAGYTFDFEKKELKKIEPENYKKQVMDEMADLVKDYIKQPKKPAWSEEDEKI